MSQHVLKEQKIDALEAGLKVRSALNKKGRFCGIPNIYAPLPFIAALPLTTYSIIASLLVAATLFAALYHLYQKDPDAITIYQHAIKTNRHFVIDKASQPLITYIGDSN